MIDVLACSLDGVTIEIAIAAGTHLAELYGRSAATEETTCNYGLNVDLQHIAGQGGLRVSATDDTREVRAVERVDHPFYVATLYQPQRTSTPNTPHPVLVGFVAAAASGRRLNRP